MDIKIWNDCCLRSKGLFKSNFCIFGKDLRLWHKLKLYNPNIFATQWFKPLIFQPLACLDTVVRKSEFVAKTQFLCPKFKTLEFWISRSILDLLFLLIFILDYFNLYSGRFLNFNQSECCIQNSKKPIRSPEVKTFFAPFNAKTLISRNPVGISKKR